MNIVVITKRELSLFCVSSMAYVVGAVFLFVTGLTFFFSVALHNASSLTRVFYVIAFAFLLVIPLFTMRLLSTEAHSGTLELLLTTPVRAWEIVVGKFLAAFLLIVVLLIPTLIYLLILTLYGNPDLFVVFSGYLGVILWGGMLTSIGLLASALSTKPAVAAALTVMFSLLLWMFGELGTSIYSSLGYLLAYLSIQEHFVDFMLGLITTNNIVYFLSITIGALFITTRILEVKRGY